MNLSPILNSPATLSVCEENHRAIRYIDLEIMSVPHKVSKQLLCLSLYIYEKN